VPDFGRVFLMLKYADLTQNTYVQSYIYIYIYIYYVYSVDTGAAFNSKVAQ
jgi:hypothetical protein